MPGYLLGACLLVLSLLFGILGIKALAAKDRENEKNISQHLATPWQDMKSPLPKARYGLSIALLFIAFICLLAVIVVISSI